MNNLLPKLGWAAFSLLGAASLGVVALSRGETISALWIVLAAISVYFIAYRFYARYLAGKVLGLNARRPTPAVRHNDGLDYVPTPRNVLFGHHFAAIAGAGPLVGPVLAVRPYCHTDHYWQVYFDSNKMIKDALGEGGFPAPMPAQTVIMQQAG